MRVTAQILTAAVLVSACGATTYTQIRHPLQVGQVDPNEVPFENTRQERGRQLPAGTLVDSAQLVTLDPNQICLRTEVWGTDLEPERADYNQYSIVLVADDNGVENVPTNVQLEQPQMMQYPGIRRVYRGGYSSVGQRHMYTITRQPATICFQNGGFVTPSTTHLTLELRGRRVNLNFEWDFVSSVAQ